MFIRPLWIILTVTLTLLFSPWSVAKTIHIVAAENFYADIAEQIGGQQVDVSSILSNPEQNPHLFEVSPKVAKSLAQADLAIYSGIGYDDWMPKLLSNYTQLKTIQVAALAARQNGDNPHIWYNPYTMLTLGYALKEQLSQLAPKHQQEFEHNWQQFSQSMHTLFTQIDTIRAQYAGTPVTATEPVFGYMFNLLGFKDLNQAFQTAVMNDTDPSISQQKQFENSLSDHKVAFLLYNNQVSEPATEQLKKLAQTHHVAIVGATETMPENIHYQHWIHNELNAIAKVLK
ncbi:metal ABC transporter solute-binding protein, Zn/Mn family [Celerinatantimonas sp. YJH-8]|uniref:metal ABC transporter solute-binding protein, Zn/Mn family n=1 Tax=Celerinatantimonas sp. YJH-8 TaxID=3228714 RepID=UPI0038C81FCA